MKKNSFIWLAAVVVCVICFGCGQKPKEEKVMARINNYTMTVADLEDEIMHSRYFKEKEGNLEQMLDLAIKRQVLVQEAQRRGLDRKKSFMQTIERYWEQTLIKELLDEESSKIYQNVGESGREKALNDWIDNLQNKARIKIYKRNLKALEKER